MIKVILSEKLMLVVATTHVLRTANQKTILETNPHLPSPKQLVALAPASNPCFNKNEPITHPLPFIRAARKKHSHACDDNDVRFKNH